MKAPFLTAALAATLWAGGALADETSKTEVQTHTEDVDVNQPGIGGSEAPASDSQTVDESVTEHDTVTRDPSVHDPMINETPGIAPADRHVTTRDTRVQVKEKESDANMRGLTWLLGGGVEGYTGALAPQVNAGPAWGVTVALKPSKVLGLELGYTGAVNEIDTSHAATAGADVSGADIVRNGGQAVATVGLTAAPVQPYLLGGVGINRYNVRAPAGSGFRSDTSGSIPLGGGVRTHVGNFTADARLGYNVLFDNEFATRVETQAVPGTTEATINGGRYTGMLQFGSTF